VGTTRTDGSQLVVRPPRALKLAKTLPVRGFTPCCSYVCASEPEISDSARYYAR